MTNNHEATKPTTADSSIGSTNVFTNDEVISLLNGLIETCKDGEQGYKEAAEGVQRSDLKSTFYEFSQQRSQFAGVLQGLVRSLGGDPESTGSFTGAIHRGWIDIKAAVTGQDESAVLNECERGEDHAKEAYEDALGKSLPANVEDVLRQQSQAVLAAHNRILELRNTESRAASS